MQSVIDKERMSSSSIITYLTCLAFCSSIGMNANTIAKQASKVKTEPTQGIRITIDSNKIAIIAKVTYQKRNISAKQQ